MPTLKPNQLQELFLSTLKLINGDANYLPMINESNNNGSFIEIASYSYDYVGREKGDEVFRRCAFDEDDLLYFVFKDITEIMARIADDENSAGDQDPKKIRFNKQIDLMNLINHKFGERLIKERNSILD